MDSKELSDMFKEPKLRKPFKLTPKRALAAQYWQIIGGTKIAQAGLDRFSNQYIHFIARDAGNAGKYDLAYKQLTKLQRDIRELFKAAGLNIK